MAAADNWKQQIKEILKDGENSKCADCGEPEATWAVHNLGVFVCIKCSGVHRQLGVHVSKVKSTEYDKWTQEQLDYVKQRGNTKMNKILEANLPRFVMKPNESEFDSIRFQFIQDKYANRLYANGNDIGGGNGNGNDNKQNENENKMDNNNPTCNFEMPMKLVTVEFYHETKKKKLYFQLLTHYLYYFRYSHDSYDFEHHQVTNLRVSIIHGGNNNNEPILEIFDKNSNKSLYRLRSSMTGNNITEQHKCLDLLQFCQQLRQSSLYYSSDACKEQKFDHEPAKPRKEFKTSDLTDGSCTVLGIANKKGGGARNWRKRWWILDNGILYYFKNDFRNDKKSKGIGIPQGEIGLLEADIIWDKKKKRTNKDNALLICTHKRTFYIQPTQQNAKSFYEAVESCCEHMWNRHMVNFATLKAH